MAGWLSQKKIFLKIFAVTIAGLAWLFMVKIPTAQAAYCWCQNLKTGVCFDNQNAKDAKGNNVPLTCADSAPPGSQTCKSYCGNYAGGGYKQIQCENVLNRWDLKPKNEGGCLPGKCWCSNNDGTCTAYKRDADGNIFDEASCNNFCLAKGARATHFNSTPTDYTNDEACAVGAAAAAPVDTGPTAESFLTNAQGLNKLTQYGPANATGVAKLIGQIIKFLTGWLASIALIFYLYAGFTWMTAGGNTEKIATAKKIYVFTTIGLAAVIGSYFVVSKLFNFIAP